MNSSKLDVLAAAARTRSYGQDHGKEIMCNPADYSSKAVARGKAQVTTGNDGFVETLYAILSDRGAESIITWLPSGKAFAILDRLEYRRLFLRNTQFDSFLRRLKRWGFKKVQTTGTVYFHELFQRDRPDLLEKMKMQGIGQRREKLNQSGAVYTNQSRDAEFIRGNMDEQKRSHQRPVTLNSTPNQKVDMITKGRGQGELVKNLIPPHISGQNRMITEQQARVQASYESLCQQQAMLNCTLDTKANYSSPPTAQMCQYLNPTTGESAHMYQFGNLDAYNPSNTVTMHCNTNTAHSQESKSTRQIQKLDEMIALCEERLLALEKFKVLKQKDMANKMMGRSQSS
jgi:hypothetical protein